MSVSPKTKRMLPWSKTAGITISRTEWEQTRADLDWWADIADALDCVVTGFTFRRCASFMNSNGQCYEVDDWFAERVLAALPKRFEPGTSVIVTIDDIDLRATVLEMVEGWVRVLFSDDSNCVVRPSRITKVHG